MQRIAMEDPLSCFYKLPLKDVCLRRVAVILCSSTAVLRYVGFMNFAPECGTPKERERRVKVMAKNKLSELSLPESMKEELVCLMKPLCRELAKWMHFHENFCKNYTLRCVRILKHVCWTPMGTIDYPKTAERLVRFRELDIDECYKLACLYCISDYIQDIWEKLPEKCVGKKLWEREQGKISFYDVESPLRVQQPEIVVFWTYIVEGREEKLDSFLSGHSSIYQYAFESVAVQGYKTATEYFFEELTFEEREESLVRTARLVANERTFDSCSYRQEYQKFSDVLMYLFSVMTEEQRMDVLQSRPCEILKCCLDWPRQDIFVQIAELAFPYLKEEDYCRLLFILCRNINWGYDYPNVFRKFFLISPKKFRDYSLRGYGHFIHELFGAGDAEAVKFIFRCLDAKEKAALVLTNSSFGCCCNLINRDMWDWAELFAREAMLSEKDKVKFTTAFVARYPRNLSMENCETFVAIVNSIDAPCLKCDKASQTDFMHFTTAFAARYPRNLPKENCETFVSLVNSIDAHCSKCDKATQIDFMPTAHSPDVHLEENPAKKHKKV